MKPEAAAWVYEHVICDYHLANEHTHGDPDQTDSRLTCACQFPCSWCANGQHDTCRRVSAADAEHERASRRDYETQDPDDSGPRLPWTPLGYGPETHLRIPAPWRPSEPMRPLYVPVWLADRVCRYLCDCTVCKPPVPPVAPPAIELAAPAVTEQLDLFEAVTL